MLPTYMNGIEIKKKKNINLNKMILRNGKFYRTNSFIKISTKKKKIDKSVITKKQTIANRYNKMEKIFKCFIRNKYDDICKICYQPIIIGSYKVSCKKDKVNYHSFHPECLLECIDYTKYHDEPYFCIISKKFKYMPNTKFNCPYCLDTIELNYNFLKNIIYT